MATWIRRRATALLVVLAAVFMMSACSPAIPHDPADLPDAANAQGATIVGITEVEDTGLLGFASPAPDSFSFEIIPDADQKINEIIMSWYLNDEWGGQEIFIPEDGGHFGRKNVILKTFSEADLPEGLLESFALQFVFVDEEGRETPAQNVYTVENPQVTGQYLIKITGNQADGYMLRNEENG